MINWHDVMVIQERNKDLLREAEHERLIQQASSGDEGPTVWQKVKDLLAGTNKNGTTEDHDYLDE
ncbi:MAG TPA: hypothetical protein VEC96_15955 [Anaerolineae bacterium]|nr:hypothetical protein [Anaerolineae bacterium]HXV99835.1 hypothetical protein [Anaerolineae bacterium]